MAKRVMKQTRKEPKRTNAAGAELLEGVRQVYEAVMTGNHEGLKVREVQIPEPSRYGAKEVRSLRDSLELSQPQFASIIGVSAEAVEHWEQGLRTPGASARRLMDHIRARPEEFLFWFLRNYASIPAPGAGDQGSQKPRAMQMLKLAARILSRQEIEKAIREVYSTADVG